MQVYPPTSHIRRLLAQRLSYVKDNDETQKWQSAVRSIESFIDPQGYQATYEPEVNQDSNEKVTVRPNDAGKPIDDVEDLDAKVRELVGKGLKQVIQNNGMDK